MNCIVKFYEIITRITSTLFYRDDISYKTFLKFSVFTLLFYFPVSLLSAESKQTIAIQAAEKFIQDWSKDYSWQIFASKMAVGDPDFKKKLMEKYDNERPIFQALGKVVSCTNWSGRIYTEELIEEIFIDGDCVFKNGAAYIILKSISDYKTTQYYKLKLYLSQGADLENIIDFRGQSLEMLAVWEKQQKITKNKIEDNPLFELVYLFEPVYEDTEVTGIRVKSSVGIPKKFGLKGGDIMVRANSIHVSSLNTNYLENFEKFANQFKNTDNLEIEVYRDKKLKVLKVTSDH